MEPISFLTSAHRSQGVIACHMVHPDMDRKYKFLETTWLYESARLISHQILFWVRVTESSNEPLDEGCSLLESFRGLVSGAERMYDTFLIAGSEATSLSDALLWTAAEHNMRVLNYAFPGSELDQYVMALERDEIINYYGDRTWYKG